MPRKKRSPIQSRTYLTKKRYKKKKLSSNEIESHCSPLEVLLIPHVAQDINMNEMASHHSLFEVYLILPVVQAINVDEQTMLPLIPPVTQDHSTTVPLMQRVFQDSNTDGQGRLTLIPPVV